MKGMIGSNRCRRDEGRRSARWRSCFPCVSPAAAAGWGWAGRHPSTSIRAFGPDPVDVSRGSVRWDNATSAPTPSPDRRRVVRLSDVGRRQVRPPFDDAGAYTSTKHDPPRLTRRRLDVPRSRSPRFPHRCRPAVQHWSLRRAHRRPVRDPVPKNKKRNIQREPFGLSPSVAEARPAAYARGPRRCPRQRRRLPGFTTPWSARRGACSSPTARLLVRATRPGVLGLGHALCPYGDRPAAFFLPSASAGGPARFAAARLRLGATFAVARARARRELV